MPKVGNETDMLGVRVAPHPKNDILVDSGGNVQSQTGGPSVAPELRKLPSFLIPKRLKPLIPDACGSNKLSCWCMGEGPFQAGGLTGDLDFRPDPDDVTSHGFIEPKVSMSIEKFREAVAFTQDQWVIDEK